MCDHIETAPDLGRLAIDKTRTARRARRGHTQGAMFQILHVGGNSAAGCGISRWGRQKGGQKARSWRALAPARGKAIYLARFHLSQRSQSMLVIGEGASCIGRPHSQVHQGVPCALSERVVRSRGSCSPRRTVSLAAARFMRPPATSRCRSAVDLRVFLSRRQSRMGCRPRHS
jgi:hypothetical protein